MPSLFMMKSTILISQMFFVTIVPYCDKAITDYLCIRELFVFF